MLHSMPKIIYFLFLASLFSACQKENENPTPDLPTTAQFAWLKSVGGANDVVIRGTFLDAQSNTHVAGTFRGTMNVGGQSLTSNGFLDFFLAKLDH